jgi:hypothetical protein
VALLVVRSLRQYRRARRAAAPTIHFGPGWSEVVTAQAADAGAPHDGRTDPMGGRGMSGPVLRRDGDTFLLVWHDEQLGIGFEHFHESSRDGLKAEVTIESMQPGAAGHVHGPAHLNLLSTESQNRLAKVLAERVNHTDWQRMLVEACALVTAEWRKPTPVVDLSMAREIESVAFVVPGVPCGETTLLYGDGESAKSLLALLIALSARTGIVLPWAARIAEPLEVMVCDWETTEQTVRARWRRMCSAYDWPDVPRLYYRAMRRPLADEVDDLRQQRDRLGIGLFIMDSLSFACAGSLNEDDAARGLMNALRQLSPATRIGIAHVSQETARATHGTARPFGSAFFWNGQRSGWEVRRAEDSPPDTLDLGLFHRKANDGQRERPSAVRVVFDGTDGPIRFSRGDMADSPDLIGRLPLPTRIRAALRAQALDTKQLADETGAAEATVRSTVRRMPDVIQLTPGSGGGSNATRARWGLRHDAV